LKKSRSLNYGQHLIDENDIQSVVSVLRGDLITQGPVIQQFELALAKKVGAKHAIAVTSGTAALHLACLASDLKSGSLGVTSAMTFVASANAMKYCGSDIGLSDIDSESLCMSPKLLKALIDESPEVQVIIPVHFAGLPADSEKIREIAGNRIIIEDASHSLGASYACGRPVGCGAYADMTVFSFHPVKPITTGEGGAIVTNNPELAHQIRMLRTHGIERDESRFINSDAAFENGIKNPWYYEQQLLGFNYRITDMQAALGLSQLKKLDSFIERRRDITRRYDEAFSKLEFANLPQLSHEYRESSGHHLYILELDFTKIGATRAEVINELGASNVGCQIHYIPIYHHPYYAKNLNLTANEFPNTENYYRQCLSIPIYPGMTEDDVSCVIKFVTKVVG
jgi:perosamine synthetase